MVASVHAWVSGEMCLSRGPTSGRLKSAGAERNKQKKQAVLFSASKCFTPKQNM